MRQKSGPVVRQIQRVEEGRISDRGSVPEIVEDGLTGFVVENQEEAVAAADRLSQLSRGAIRRRFEERFTARMAREYLVVYRSLIEFEALRSRAAIARAS